MLGKVTLTSILISSFLRLSIIDKTDQTCVAYKSMLPSGSCAEYLYDATVYSAADEDIIQTDLQIGLVTDVYFPAIGDLMKRNSVSKLKKHLFQSLVNFTCFGKSDHMKRLGKELVDRIPIYDELMEFQPYLTWFVCHLRFPICLNGDPRKLSFPCKQEYNLFANKLKLTTFLEKNWIELSRQCRSLFREEDALFQSSFYVTADIRNIERCHRYDRQTYSKQHLYTDSCYEDNGVTYNGTMNISSNGQVCVPWHSFPALRSNYYSELHENYCRNPQGYGESPWCYTDIKKRDWSHCNLVKCSSQQKPHTQNKSKAVLYILISLAIISVMGILSRLMMNRRSNNRKDEYIEPYYATPLTSPERIEMLLAQK